MTDKIEQFMAPGAVLRPAEDAPQLVKVDNSRAVPKWGMRTVKLCGAAACAMAMVSQVACASLPGIPGAVGPGNAGTAAAILRHIELCNREYHGALGAGITGSFDIKCEAIAPDQAEALAKAANLPVN
jgi:hypothetical protein